MMLKGRELWARRVAKSRCSVRLLWLREKIESGEECSDGVWGFEGEQMAGVRTEGEWCVRRQHLYCCKAGALVALSVVLRHSGKYQPSNLPRHWEGTHLLFLSLQLPLSCLHGAFFLASLLHLGEGTGWLVGSCVMMGLGLLPATSRPDMQEKDASHMATHTQAKLPLGTRTNLFAPMTPRVPAGLLLFYFIAAVAQRRAR
ncbi:hypothetical protein QBC40DRAFT_1859 [Triangularia verruculosa]|uniref:Uncharacterized protein n=1 Tax=Triangularia verruculosa TaxID=2587418 RepID=A0AAN6XWD0_9PEZI|nr:hypothetical protein QBC40DRAFT_1859 [Triangularia verruculosa]